MRHSDQFSPVLSICLTCRDDREAAFGDVRGGTRLAQAVLDKAAQGGRAATRLRGVRCMSQCKRACVASLGGHGRFTYVFGDLDPDAPDHVAALLSLPGLFSATPEGFLRRDERPEPLRARIIGRLPPLETGSDLVSPLDMAELR